MTGSAIRFLHHEPKGVLIMVVLALVTACRPAAEPSVGPEPIEATSPAEAPASPSPSSATGWSPIAEEDGILVTSRPSEHSPLPVFRGMGVVEASLLEVLAVVIDAERHHEWVFSCSGSGMVEQTTASAAIVYNRTATPWPVPDRDVVLESRVEVLDGEREILVRFVATEHPDRPPEDGVVRMTYLQGHYHLWAEDEAHTRVEYQVDSDPGGRLPPWLATRGTREMPLGSLRGLRTQVVQTRGLYAERIEALRQAIQGHD